MKGNEMEYKAGLASLFAGHAREDRPRPILRYCRKCRGLMFHRLAGESVTGRVYVCSCGHTVRVR